MKTVSMKSLTKAMIGLLSVAVAALVLAGCASQLSATTDYDPSVNFSEFQTFGWIDPNPLISSVTRQPVSPLVVTRMMDDARELLEARGLRFEEDPAAADLAVAFSIGSRDGLRITNVPTRSFRSGPRGRRDYRWRGYWPNNSVQTTQYQEGQLAVDLFSVAEARPVWHGTTRSRITRSDRDNPSELIREALEAIFAKFPPK